jgi:hypothetical protein
MSTHVADDLPAAHDRVTVRVEKKGFKKISVVGNPGDSRGRLTVNVRLEPGVVTETVSVHAQTKFRSPSPTNQLIAYP